MLRTIVIALCVLPLALPVSACGDDREQVARAKPSEGSGRDRVVCLSAGRVVYDDFSKSTSMDEGGIRYDSVATGHISRVMGECFVYRAEIPEGWKATLPAPDPNATTIETVR